MWTLSFYILGIVGFLYVMLCGPNRYHRNGVVGWMYRKLNGAPDVIGTCLFTAMCCSKKRGNKMMDKCAMCLCETRNPIMQVLYVVLIGGAVYMFFWQCYPLLDPKSTHKTGAPLAVAFAFGSYIIACLADPGKLTAESVDTHKDIYPYDNIFFYHRQCTTCTQVKPARSKHCRACGFCIARFDHHCAWINHCVGANNYRYFLMFVISHAILTGYGFYLCCDILWKVMLREQLWDATFILSDGRKVQSNWTILFQYFVTRYGLVLAEGLFLVCICAMMLGFFGYHAWLVSINQTINESFKWGEFEEAMADEGLSHEYKDVKNIWSNGFIQNWLEIIFPFHLRPGYVTMRKKKAKEEYEILQKTVKEQQEAHAKAQQKPPPQSKKKR